jgi:GNAT superfamily N-acetyltransferase
MSSVNHDRATRGAVAPPITPQSAEHRIRTAASDDATRLATALAAAFYDDPLFRWFSPVDRRRGAMLPSLFDVLVEAFRIHGETYTDHDVAGAALWAAPNIDPLNAEQVYAERLEEIAGIDAPRLFEVVQIFEAHAPQQPYYHLQFLGVLPERQGVGLGGALMAPILERCDRDGAPAYLEATSDRNRALYERHGFRAYADIPLPGGPTVWQMWRDPLD